MKFICILAMSMASIVASAQESLHFETGTFAEILAKAKKENKLVFMDAYASWCGPCKMMERDIFTKPTVQQYYNTKFINSHFDMEKGEGPKIAQKYQIRSYPTFLFLNGDGVVVKKSMGYQNEEQFLALGKEADNPLFKGESMRKRFEKGESDPEFLINLITLNLTSDMEFARMASERYFAVKKTPGLTKDEVYILLNSVNSLKSPNYRALQKYRSEIIKVMPEQNLVQFENTIKLSDIAERAINKDKKEINDAQFLFEAEKLIGKEAALEYLQAVKLNFYTSVADYESFATTAIQYYAHPETANPDELMKVATVISEHSKNTIALKKASEWAESSVMKGETAENTYLLAKLYFRIGKNDLAKDFAATSRRLSISAGQDSAKVDLLLNEINKK